MVMVVSDEEAVTRGLLGHVAYRAEASILKEATCFQVARAPRPISVERRRARWTPERPRCPVLPSPSGESVGASREKRGRRAGTSWRGRAFDLPFPEEVNGLSSSRLTPGFSNPRCIRRRRSPG